MHSLSPSGCTDVKCRRTSMRLITSLCYYLSELAQQQNFIFFRKSLTLVSFGTCCFNFLTVHHIYISLVLQGRLQIAVSIRQCLHVLLSLKKDWVGFPLSIASKYSINCLSVWSLENDLSFGRLQSPCAVSLHNCARRPRRTYCWNVWFTSAEKILCKSARVINIKELCQNIKDIDYSYAFISIFRHVMNAMYILD